MKLSEEFTIFIGKLSYLLDDKLKDCVDDLQKFQNGIEKLEKYNKNTGKQLTQRIEELDRKNKELEANQNQKAIEELEKIYNLFNGTQILLYVENRIAELQGDKNGF